MVEFWKLVIQNQVDSPAQETNLIPFLTATVCSIRNQSDLPDIDTLLQRCYDVAIGCHLEAATVSASMCLGGLVNKASLDSNSESFIQKTECQLLKILEDESSNSTQKEKATIVWSWLAKALVLRNHNRQSTFTNQLVDMLGRQAVGERTVDGFRIVLEDCEEVMSDDSHAVSTLMFRQRFFVLTLNRLLDGYHASEIDQKQYYLSALSHLIRFVPKQVVQSELPTILPLLVQSLMCDNEMLWITTLESLNEFLRSSPNSIGSHVDDLIPRILVLTNYKPKMTIRIAALKCIDLFPSTLPIHRLITHRKDVLRQLSVCLDDHKRLVRREATEASCNWSLLGEPTKN